MDLSPEQFDLIRKTISSPGWALMKLVASQHKPATGGFVVQDSRMLAALKAERLDQITGWELAMLALEHSGDAPTEPPAEIPDDFPDTGLPGYEAEPAAKRKRKQKGA